MQEAAVYKGQRAELRLKLHELEIRIDSLKKSIRLACNAVTPPDKLNAEEVFMLATDLRATQIDFLEAAQKLDKISEILGD